LDLTVDTAGICVLVAHIGQLDTALYRLVEKYRGITSEKLKSEVRVAMYGVLLGLETVLMFRCQVNASVVTWQLYVHSTIGAKVRSCLACFRL
jgi:hypothetical protein